MIPSIPTLATEEMAVSPTGGSQAVAPSFQSIGTIAYGSRTDTTIPAPTGIVDGDLLLMVLWVGQSTEAPDPTVPAGFTLVPGSWPIDVTGGGFNGELRAWVKSASGESGDYLVTHSGASTVGGILRISGYSGSTILTSLNSGTGQTTTATGLALTAVSLAVFAQVDFDGSGAHTGPAGMTERFDNAGMIISTVAAASGPTGDKTMTNQNAGAGFFAATLIGIPGA